MDWAFLDLVIEAHFLFSVISLRRWAGAFKFLLAQTNSKGTNASVHDKTPGTLPPSLPNFVYLHNNLKFKKKKKTTTKTDQGIEKGLVERQGPCTRKRRPRKNFISTKP
ncbi:unnamed protein product [Prunus armeniaca]